MRRKKLAAIFGMLTCLLRTFVEFFLILNTTAITRNVTVTSGNVCIQSGWQLPVEAVLDSIVYLNGMSIYKPNRGLYRPHVRISECWKFFACGIWKPGLWNPKYSSMNGNSTKVWNSESKFHWQRMESSSWNPKSTA